ncbi:hypothetical protein [Aliiglaciecola sp. NS0011-25]|uniref:hypothetical protein n=1 Tax=Aliiglaciecola sp. NS0011-25 TaxID=3127654 RepID=UPI0031073FF2
MNKWRIEYNANYTKTPLSFWEHKDLDHEVRAYAKEFDPKLPRAIPCRGFPMLIVDVLGVQLIFASVAEVEHFLFVIGQKNMPTTQQLSRQRINNYGTNRHWLRRLPSSIKAWSKRKRIIPIVEKGLHEFREGSAFSTA